MPLLQFAAVSHSMLSVIQFDNSMTLITYQRLESTDQSSCIAFSLGLAFLSSCLTWLAGVDI